MQLFTAIVPVSPMRATASHRAEMVSQFLFGEQAELLEEEKDFIRLHTLHDGYEGWCQRSQLAALTNQLPATGKFAAGWHNEAFFNDTLIRLPLGTPLDLFEAPELINGKQVRLSYQGEVFDRTPTASALEDLARLYLHTAYLWGGRTVWGIDCSGYVQQLYRFFGLSLPRDAWQQALEGETVSFLQQAQTGDLAFFDNAEGRIVHVGLMLSNHEIIHAAGQVRIDDIDNMGIVHRETGARTHQLRIIKRYRTLA